VAMGGQPRKIMGATGIITSEQVLILTQSCQSSDANKDGLEALILQMQKSTWKPVAYPSTAMTSAEKNYAKIERELLSIMFACEWLHQFIYWTPVQAEIDHKPLVNIMKKPLNDCPLRIQRLLMRLQRYDLDVTYTPGKQLVAADALSSATAGEDSSSREEPVELHVNLVVKTMPMLDRFLDHIKKRPKVMQN